MERNLIEEKVREIVIDRMDGDEAEMGPDTRFKEDLFLDSLDEVEVIMDAEKSFDITINDEETARIKTVGQLCDTVEKLLDMKNK